MLCSESDVIACLLQRAFFDSDHQLHARKRLAPSAAFKLNQRASITWLVRASRCSGNSGLSVHRKSAMFSRPRAKIRTRSTPRPMTVGPSSGCALSYLCVKPPMSSTSSRTSESVRLRRRPRFFLRRMKAASISYLVNSSLAGMSGEVRINFASRRANSHGGQNGSPFHDGASTLELVAFDPTQPALPCPVKLLDHPS